MEAESVTEWVHYLITLENIDMNDIGIVAPFRGQVDLIRKHLRKRKYRNVNVGTVEDYQGKEMGVIIVSTVRSTKKYIQEDVKKSHGVIHQAKRTNVAMTRAIGLFIIIGDPDILMEDEHWFEYLHFCDRNGLWKGNRGGFSKLRRESTKSMIEQVR